MGEFEKVSPGARRKWEPNVEIRFPPLPHTVAEVTNLAAEDVDPPDTPRLAGIVKMDPVVGSSVLRRINSAYYGMRTRIVDIDKACQLLGFDEVRDIVLTASMMKLGEVFDTKVQRAIFDQIVVLSMGAACYNKKIADEFDLPHKGLAFTTGLLHTIGRLILLYNRPDEYEKLWYTTEAGQPPSVASEQVIFGTDHTELSVVAGKEWNLPEDAIKVIRYYLTPGHVKNQALRVLSLSLAIASAATDYFCLNAKSPSTGEFKPPAALYALARQVEAQPAILTNLIEQQREDVLRFIHSMVEPTRD